MHAAYTSFVHVKDDQWSINKSTKAYHATDIQLKDSRSQLLQFLRFGYVLARPDICNIISVGIREKKIIFFSNIQYQTCLVSKRFSTVWWIPLQVLKNRNSGRVARLAITVYEASSLMVVGGSQRCKSFLYLVYFTLAAAITASIQVMLPITFLTRSKMRNRAYSKFYDYWITHFI